jgi:hypothetical protein
MGDKLLHGNAVVLISLPIAKQPRPNMTTARGSFPQIRGRHSERC